MSNIDIDKILKEKEKEEKAISDVISGLAFHFEQKDQERSADDIQKVCEYYNTFKNDDYYATTMYLICERFNKVPAKPWLLLHPEVDKWDKFIIESIFNGLFKHWLYRMIQIHEDQSGGQADKEAFITKIVLKSIEDHMNLSLYSEYKDEPGKQAYWSPRYFKDTHQVKLEFVSWWRNVEPKEMEQYIT